MTLSVNRQIARMADPDLRGFLVATGQHIYHNALVGVHPATGYLKPFEPGDLFVGMAEGEADNSSGADGATAMTVGHQGTVQVWILGEIQHTLASVAQTDVDPNRELLQLIPRKGKPPLLINPEDEGEAWVLMPSINWGEGYHYLEFHPQDIADIREMFFEHLELEG